MSHFERIIPITTHNSSFIYTKWPLAIVIQSLRSSIFEGGSASSSQGI